MFEAVFSLESPPFSELFSLTPELTDLLTPNSSRLLGADTHLLDLEAVEHRFEFQRQLAQAQKPSTLELDWLTGQSLVSVISPLNNTSDSAKDIVVGSTPTTYKNSISLNNPNNYYRFFLNDSASFNLTLNTLRGNANVELLSGDGTTVIASSLNTGTTQDKITRSLNAGTYYIRVFPDSGKSRYKLTVATPESVATSHFKANYGYGLVNAAAAVARTLEQPTFADVPNLGGNNWGNDLVKAAEVWAQGYTGEGVTVAVIDDGVDILHEDLIDNIWTNSGEIAGNGLDDDGNNYIDDLHGWNFTTGVEGNNGNVRPENGYSDHGTHVAGTIAASHNGFGATGVAYNANIMALKVANTTTKGQWIETGNIANAIRYAVDNGAKVINMSLRWTDSPALKDALNYAASHNVIAVTAAGNDGASSPIYVPARYATQYGLTVGAVNSSSTLASFSNRAGSDSTMRYVVAPGVGIYSTVPNNRYEGGWRGTSMASPHVAGVVALMLDANPSLTHAQVRDYITGTATSLG